MIVKILLGICVLTLFFISFNRVLNFSEGESLVGSAAATAITLYLWPKIQRRLRLD